MIKINLIKSDVAAPRAVAAPGAAPLGAATAESWPPRHRRDVSMTAFSPVDFNDCAQVAAWDLMARDDTAGLQALFKQRQATAQNVIGDLGKLQRQLADLGGPKPTHVVSVTVPAGPTLRRNQIFSAPHWLVSTQAPRKASPSRRRPPTARRSGSRCPRGHLPARRCMYAYR